MNPVGTDGVNAPGTANKIIFLLADNSAMLILLAGESSKRSIDGTLSPSWNKNRAMNTTFIMIEWIYSLPNALSMADRALNFENFLQSSFIVCSCVSATNYAIVVNNFSQLTLICTILLVEIDRANICETALTENWFNFNNEFINNGKKFNF